MAAPGGAAPTFFGAYGEWMQSKLPSWEDLRWLREQWDGPLIARIPATDWHPRGLGVDEAITIARAVRDAGADAVHLVAGQARAETAPEYRPGYLTAHAERVRNGAGVTTVVGGYLTTLDEVNTIVGAGRADLCVVEPEALATTEGGPQA
jgi:anthraniloyl-CoA monooxygenase